jgi:hypothetical protein
VRPARVAAFLRELASAERDELLELADVIDGGSVLAKKEFRPAPSPAGADEVTSAHARRWLRSAGYAKGTAKK